MPHRPLPLIPHGPKRQREPLKELVVACPRICPVWQLQAVRALIKPQFKDAIAHRDSAQRWNPDDRQRARLAWNDLQLRIAQFDLELPPIHFPRAGDFWLIAKFTRANIGLAKKVAQSLSVALPEHWLVVGNLYARNGQIYRRKGLRRLELAVVKNLRLPERLQRA